MKPPIRQLLPAAAVLCLAACRAPDPEPPAPAKVPVTSEVLEAGPFRASLDLLGRVEPAERLELRPAFAGRLRYPPRFAAGLATGERVRRGEVLFTVDNPDVALRLAEAALALRAAEAELERARRGVAGGFLAVAELETREIEAELAAERLATARHDARRLEVRAPAHGVLRVERVRAAGTEVTPRDLVAELAGDGDLRVEAWAAASDLGRLEPGLEVECRAPGSERVAGRGRVREVAREVDAAGVARLVASLDDDLGMPRPGEGVELRVLLPERAEVVSVPETALVIQGSVATVFVLEPSGDGYQARARVVEAGSRDAGRVAVRAGVAAGERVAVAGAEYLADGLLAVETAGGGV